MYTVCGLGSFLESSCIKVYVGGRMKLVWDHLVGLYGCVKIALYYKLLTFKNEK
jgi:hypothetical protein